MSKRSTRTKADTTREAIIAELDAIEANPTPCLPDAECTCDICMRYCDLYAKLDALDEKDRS